MKPHINNNKTPKLQITELDSIRHIVALSGTHLEEATEPKKQSSTQRSNMSKWSKINTANSHKFRTRTEIRHAFPLLIVFHFAKTQNTTFAKMFSLRKKHPYLGQPLFIINTALLTRQHKLIM